MREKKVIKLRTDMYEDTKFKIIDTMDERDTINYLWTRVLTLCGKVNDSEGRLYVTKNMPYTIEILALEFNRTKEQVENAMKVFCDLNMICRDEDGVFKVCNWNKYQGSGKNGGNNHKDEGKEQEAAVAEEKSIKENKKEEIYNKREENKEEYSKDTKDIKDNKNETNIIDITKGDLVKDKNADSRVHKKENDIKTKRKGKKNVRRNSDIVTYDDKDNSDEIICFTDGEPVSDGSKQVAIYNFE